MAGAAGRWRGGRRRPLVPARTGTSPRASPGESPAGGGSGGALPNAGGSPRDAPAPPPHLTPARPSPAPPSAPSSPGSPGSPGCLSSLRCACGRAEARAGPAGRRARGALLDSALADAVPPTFPRRRGARQPRWLCSFHRGGAGFREVEQLPPVTQPDVAQLVVNTGPHSFPDSGLIEGSKAPKARCR